MSARSTVPLSLHCATPATFPCSVSSLRLYAAQYPPRPSSLRQKASAVCSLAAGRPALCPHSFLTGLQPFTQHRLCSTAVTAARYTASLIQQLQHRKGCPNDAYQMQMI
eukprot:GHVS01035100.1.p2 GENE.GHVS01035100.1~~GHVS01035100.1.p2  ORF type:complete len:109 (+),score=3.84 GHVS01035100.1:229-555(+)